MVALLKKRDLVEHTRMKQVPRICLMRICAKYAHIDCVFRTFLLHLAGRITNKFAIDIMEISTK